MLVKPFKILKHIIKSAFKRLNSNDSKRSTDNIACSEDVWFAGVSVSFIIPPRRHVRDNLFRANDGNKPDPLG